MAADPFPLSYPGDVRPGFQAEAALRRIAQYCGIGRSTRVLAVGFGAGAAPGFFAKELGAAVVAIDSSEEALSRQRDRLRQVGAEAQVHARRVDYSRLPFGEGEFEVVVLDALAPLSLGRAAAELRRILAPSGRLCAVYPVRVARHPSPSVIRLWEERIQEPLGLPRDCLQILEGQGYEPIACEVLDDAALSSFYRQVEGALPRAGEGDEALAPFREEVALFRSQAGRSPTSFALLVGRRREPGEKPPISRNT